MALELINSRRFTAAPRPVRPARRAATWRWIDGPSVVASVSTPPAWATRGIAAALLCPNDCDLILQVVGTVLVTLVWR